MKYRRMPIEIESPEQLGYDKIKCNLTESSMPDVKGAALGAGVEDLLLCYTDHAGKPELRELIALESENLNAGDVIVTVGAAAALFLAATSLLEPADRVLVAHPNYATNVETPRAIGCGVDLHRLRFEQGFALDVERLAKTLAPGTKLISLTTPHNPTGAVISEEELHQTIELAESRGCLLLVDETYRGMEFGAAPPVAASLSPNAISVSSLSKTHGLPGIRTGWLITRNPALKELFLAAKEQVFICNSVVDEHLAFLLLSRRAELLPEIKKKVAGAFSVVKEWIETEPRLEWVAPEGGVVCFPRIREDSGVDVDRFYKTLNEEYGTYVGPGHWFEMDRRHFRIGYGWPPAGELEQGLRNISAALAAAR